MKRSAKRFIARPNKRSLTMPRMYCSTTHGTSRHNIPALFPFPSVCYREGASSSTDPLRRVLRRLLPCGYIMGVHGELVAGIPGLKSETPRHAGAGWGTLRGLPTGIWRGIAGVRNYWLRKILALPLILLVASFLIFY